VYSVQHRILQREVEAIKARWTFLEETWYRIAGYDIATSQTKRARFDRASTAPTQQFLPLQTLSQGRKKGGKGRTISLAPNLYGSAEWLRGHPKVPTMSQVLSSVQYIQYIWFRKTPGSNLGVPNLLLAPAPANLVTPLHYYCNFSASSIQAARSHKPNTVGLDWLNPVPLKWKMLFLARKMRRNLQKESSYDNIIHDGIVDMLKPVFGGTSRVFQYRFPYKWMSKLGQFVVG